MWYFGFSLTFLFMERRDNVAIGHKAYPRNGQNNLQKSLPSMKIGSVEI